ncbi:MAG: hypothetical protein WDO24_24580 [Pseudomonadota bacterium]
MIRALGVEMLLLAKRATDPADAARRLDDALGSGAAAVGFGAMVAALGGPRDLVEHPGRALRPRPTRHRCRRAAPASSARSTRARSGSR